MSYIEFIALEHFFSKVSISFLKHGYIVYWEWTYLSLLQNLYSGLKAGLRLIYSHPTLANPFTFVCVHFQVYYKWTYVLPFYSKGALLLKGKKKKKVFFIKKFITSECIYCPSTQKRKKKGFL